MNLLGTAAKHVLNAALRAVRAIFLTFIIVALVVALITEAIGAYITRSIPPTGATHLAAAALAIAFGYAAAVTVFVEEILRAMIKAIELIVEESEKLAVVAVHDVEKAAGAVAHEAGVVTHAAGSDASALGRGAVSVASGIVGGLAHGAQGVEHEVASLIPGHRNDDNG
jgi:hypothetical protein